jgi:hypothetical protein
MAALRPVVAVVLALALFALAAPPARAQAGAPPPAYPVTAIPDPEYDAALDALKKSRWGEGTRLLDRYLERADAPHRAEAEALRELARHLAVQVEAALPEGTLDQRGRVELAVFGTTYGVFAGLLVSYLAMPEDGGEFSTALLTTTAVAAGGLTLALASTAGREITEGRAKLISMGGTWATLNSAAIALELGARDKTLAGTVLAAGLGGIVLGALDLGETPPPGYLALVNSVGLWSGYVTGMVLAAAEMDLDSEDLWALVVAGADVGLVTTALLAEDVRISPGRVRLIDLGGFLGTLGGLAVASTSDFAPAPILVGSLVGLGATALATRTWDEPAGGEVRDGVAWRGPGPTLLPGTDGKSLVPGVALASARF